MKECICMIASTNSTSTDTGYNTKVTLAGFWNKKDSVDTLLIPTTGGQKLINKAS